ncbi:hypothetical protein H4217_005409 [Coemansia sp. RSA 1939]|nr:hypothetical protein H4217_005409 [Coemansia sp. RSA 1939]
MSLLAKNNTTTNIGIDTNNSEKTISKRDVTVDDVLDFKSALLLIDGKETSCEAALIDSSAGFLTASCLQYSNGDPDMKKNYTLAIKMGRGTSATVTKRITSIAVHPKYNSTTFVNNLAVVQFDEGNNIAWQNYIGINPDEWNNLYFIRRALDNVPSLTWSNVVAYSSTDTPDKCASASTTYKANSDDFLCNYAASLSVFNSDCKVPYGTVFAGIQPSNMAVVAIYSHSAVYGSSMCSVDTKTHYYTLLRNYLSWAATTINRSIGGFAQDSSYKFSPDSTYAMKGVSSVKVDGVTLFTGNRYAQDPVDDSLSADIYATPTPTSSNKQTGSYEDDPRPKPTPSNAGAVNSGSSSSTGSSSGSASRSNTGDTIINQTTVTEDTNVSDNNADGSSTETGNSSDSGDSKTDGTDSTNHSHTGSATNTDDEITELTDDGESDDTEDNETESDESSDSADGEDGKSGSGKVSPIAIVVPIIIVVLIIGGAGIVWYVRRRRRKIEEQTNALHNANMDDDDDDNVTPMHHRNESNESIMNYYNNDDDVNLPPPSQQPHQQMQQRLQMPNPQLQPPQHLMSQYTTDSHMFNQPYTGRSTHYNGNL